MARDIFNTLSDPDKAVAEQAALVLGTLGGRALPTLPTLLDGLRSPDADRRRIAALAVGEVLAGGGRAAEAADTRRTALASLSAAAQQDASAAVRGQALRALAALGPDAAAEDLPATLQALEDSDTAVQGRATEVLAGLGPASEPLLRAALRKPNPLVRRAALSGLVRLRPAGIVDLLAAHLSDKDWGTAHIAAEALAALGEDARPAMPSLVGALSSPLNVVRDAALKALEPLDPERECILQGFMNALRTKSRPAQAWAAERLAKLKEKAAPAVPLLIPLVRRVRGGKIALAIREAGAAAVPAITAAITQPDRAAREQAFDALSSIHWQAYNALRPFREQLGAPPPEVQAKISEALAALGAPAAGQLQQLLTRLKDRGAWRTRCDAAIALGKLGPKAAPAVKDLIAALKDSDSDVREKSAEALGLIGPGAAEAAPALLEKLNDSQEKVRVAATLALGRVGQQGKTPLEPLLTLIRRENNTADALRVALQLLARHGRDALPALPQLIPLLRHDDAGVRTWAAWALGQIGPDARASADDLRKALDDRHPRVQAWAAGAYFRVTGEAGPILPALERLLPCREPDVRKGVVDAAREAGAAVLPLLREESAHSDPRYREGAADVLGRLGAAAAT